MTIAQATSDQAAGGNVVDARAERLAREKRGARFKGFLTDAGLVAYGLLLLRYLVEGSFTSVAKGETASLPWGQVIVFGGLGGGALWSLSARSAGRTLMRRTSPLLRKELPVPDGSYWKSIGGLVTLALGALTAVAGWQVTGISLRDLFNSEGMAGAQRIFSALFTPDWSIIAEVIERMMETIFMAFVATIVAIPVAFLASFPSARNLMSGSVSSVGIYGIFRLVANFTRSIEPVIWAVVFSVWVGVGTYAGMLALMIHSVAALTKLYSEQIENVENGPIEAIEATGANRLQVLWYAVVPQVVLPFLSFTIYRWDINVRMATIIGILGGGGIGTLLMQYQGKAQWHQVGTIVIVVALVVWAMDYLSARLRSAIY